MKLSKIKEKIDNSGDNNGSATIYHYDLGVKCIYHLFDGEKYRLKTIRYKSLELDIPVNLDSFTICNWSNKRGFNGKYINYYDKRIL